ncbi:MAG: U32 family peptidase [Planctomycetota bacterium]|jgi:collagenase-like PrtC family protease|nr:U32 family peptidase [Planctomycetota bacterium]
MELLAPAGDFAALEAAVAAGADAVYLGLSLLNARRSARNFTPRELERAVETAAARKVKVYLTLNIDVSRREVGAAARILTLARDAGVAAVIVRDPGTVRLWGILADLSSRSGIPRPALHFSTQAAVTNPEAARMAAELGASRVILARELTLPEIRRVKERSGLEIEVFAQGALCYSISGRCLMSSWGGGRSGNRGLCTSPCRAPWSIDGEAVGTVMSMRDLAVVDRLRELRDAGVDALKIEGRLKKPEWVAEAVALYREALGPRRTGGDAAEKAMPGVDIGDALRRAEKLAAYAGREITPGFISGVFSGLTGIAARKSRDAARSALDELFADREAEKPARTKRPAPGGGDAGYTLEMTVGDKGVFCRASYRGATGERRLPKSVIRRERKALSIADLFAGLRNAPINGVPLAAASANAPGFMLPPRNVKAVRSLLGSFLSRAGGNGGDGDAVMRTPLPDALRRAVKAGPAHRDNRRSLGERPNQVRLAAQQLAPALARLFREAEAVVTVSSLDDLELVSRHLDPGAVTLAFPTVFFPFESRKVARLAEACRDRSFRIEANDWGAVWLARRHGLTFTTGPGLAVLNHVAADLLRDLGAEAVTVSLEADRRQMEELTAASRVPLTLVVYARPPLAYTRVAVAESLPGRAEGETGTSWADRRGIRLSPLTGSSITEFRALSSFSLAGIHNRAIKAANLAVYLVGEASPLAAWSEFSAPTGDLFRFNYDRGLK